MTARSEGRHRPSAVSVPAAWLAVYAPTTKHCSKPKHAKTGWPSWTAELETNGFWLLLRGVGDLNRDDLGKRAVLELLTANAPHFD